MQPTTHIQPCRPIEQIAFASDPDHPDLRGRQMTRANGELGPQMAMEVYVMRVDGTGSARLTNDTVPSFVGQQALAPRWAETTAGLLA
jgi:hypothetical protein